MKRGFTLAELLIALAILGVIATFTIPKVLQAQQDSKSKAIAKEAAATISEAYAAFRLNNTAAAGTGFSNLSPYLNYVRLETASSADDVPGWDSVDCSSSAVCYRLHNGAILWHFPESFGGTDSTNAIRVSVDPDGALSNSTADGPGKAVQFWLYYNGRLKTWSSMEPNTYSSTIGPESAAPSQDPSWFSWN